MEYILIFISAIFVNNIVLSQFLGICPFLGVSKKVETAMGMSAAVAFVLTIAYHRHLLDSEVCTGCFGLGYLQTITFILVIAGLVQMVEIILKKVSPALYQALGVFLPLITTNCCILGVAILVIQKDYDLADRCLYTQFSYGYRLRSGTGAFCRIARTDEPCENSERNARNSDCFDYRRFACYGIHGILRRGVRIYS